MKLWFDQLWPHAMEWGYNWMILWRRRATLARVRADALEALVDGLRMPVGVIVGGDWVVRDALEWAPEALHDTLPASPGQIEVTWDDTIEEVSG